MPASWDFEIYEDSPEEEAANLMEHSTQILDLSSDDEAMKAKRDYRGKENEAPEGYDAPVASRQAATATEPSLPTPKRVKKTEIVRRKTTEMDDGERSPLSDLETDEFVPEGLTKDAHVIVEASPEKTKLDVKGLFTASPPSFTFSGLKKEGKKSSKLSITSTAAEEEPVAIWEDESASEGSGENAETVSQEASEDTDASA